MTTVPEIMTEAKHTFEERGIVYGENYRKFGKVMAALFPAGLELKTIDQWNRFGIFAQMLSKVTRYSNNFFEGHIDSVHDLGVYSFMLELLDREAEEKFEQFCAEEDALAVDSLIDMAHQPNCRCQLTPKEFTDEVGNDHPPLPFPLPDPFADTLIHKGNVPLHEAKNYQVSKKSCPGHIYDEGVCMSCGAKRHDSI
jgi:hypothetical protein